MIFFLTLTVSWPFHMKDLKWKKYGGAGLVSEQLEALYAELNERVEAAYIYIYLQYIYSVHVTKNLQNIQSRQLVHEFFFTDIFNDINHGYRAAILKKNYSWLHPFYIAVWLLISMIKRWPERCALHLYNTADLSLHLKVQTYSCIWNFKPIA